MPHSPATATPIKARLISEAPSRSLVVGLAGLAGIVNAAGFHAIGHFSSHLSGTVAVLSEELAGADWTLALVAVWVIVCFIAGAATTAIMMTSQRERHLRGRYARCLIAEALLLVGIAAVDQFIAPGSHGILSVRVLLLWGGLSFLMGFQNAIVTQISHARIRTTHVTGMITDIGVALGQRLAHWRHPDWHLPSGFARSPVMMHVMTVSAFIGGGIAGVFGYRGLGPIFLLLVAAVLLAVGLYDLARRRG
ncbi:MAG: YoaK family protein [Elstera sp.]